MLKAKISDTVFSFLPKKQKATKVQPPSPFLITKNTPYIQTNSHKIKRKVRKMRKFRLAIFNTQPPHLYFGGVERRIMETAKRLQTQADITVYCGTKAGFKQSATINGVEFVPCY